MDAEVVAVDPTTGDVKSFQELSNRPKKDVNLREVKVVVCVYAFDLMYLNGQVSESASAISRMPLTLDDFTSSDPSGGTFPLPKGPPSHQLSAFHT